MKIYIAVITAVIGFSPILTHAQNSETDNPVAPVEVHESEVTDLFELETPEPSTVGTSKEGEVLKVNVKEDPSVRKIEIILDEGDFDSDSYEIEEVITDEELRNQEAAAKLKEETLLAEQRAEEQALKNKERELKLEEEKLKLQEKQLKAEQKSKENELKAIEREAELKEKALKREAKMQQDKIDAAEKAAKQQEKMLKAEQDAKEEALKNAEKEQKEAEKQADKLLNQRMKVEKAEEKLRDAQLKLKEAKAKYDKKRVKGKLDAKDKANFEADFIKLKLDIEERKADLAKEQSKLKRYN